MLNCRQATEQASALLDGELTRAARWSLRLHLMICHNCRRYLAQLRLTVRAVRRLADSPEMAIGVDVNAIADRLQSESRR